MTKVMSSISSALGLPELEVAEPVADTQVIEVVDPPVPETSAAPVSDVPVESAAARRTRDAETDFGLARQNIKDAIEEGISAFGRATLVAQSSDNARSFEVVSEMLREIVQANKELIELHKSRSDLATQSEIVNDVPGATTYNNTIVVSSPAQLAELVHARLGDPDANADD